jgi:rhamnulose-1-phosphate aldolase
MPLHLNEKLRKTIRSVASTGQWLWEKGWAEKNAGNLSCDVTDSVRVRKGDLKASGFRPLPGFPRELAGRSLLVTGTGTRFRDIEKNQAGCLCVLRLSEKGDGYHFLWGGESPGFRPTSEITSHLRMQHSLLRMGGRSKTVLHTHPNELIALTHLPGTNGQDNLNRALWSMIPEAKLFVPRGVGWVPYRLTGSGDLAEATLEVLDRGYRVVLWEKHGALAVGADPEEAFDLLDAMNKAAVLYLLCLQTGQKPQGLTMEQVEEIARTYPARED